MSTYVPAKGILYYRVRFLYFSNSITFFHYKLYIYGLTLKFYHLLCRFWGIIICMMNVWYSVHPTFSCLLAQLGTELIRTLIGRRVLTAWLGKIFTRYRITRRYGCYAPILLTPAEGWGAFRAPWTPVELQCPNLEL